MKKSTVTLLLSKGVLSQFKDIFKVHFYHKTKVCAEIGIGYWRLSTVVNCPSKMTLLELQLLADYFEVSRELLLAAIDKQLEKERRKKK